MIDIASIQTALKSLGFLTSLHEVDGVWDNTTETAYRNAAESENMPHYLCVQPQNEDQLPPVLRGLITGDVSDAPVSTPDTSEAKRALEQQQAFRNQEALEASSGTIDSRHLELDKDVLETDAEVNMPDTTGTDEIRQ